MEGVELGSDLTKRFMSFVSVNHETGCWDWTGSTSRGYGQLSSSRNKSPHKAHRLSFEMHVGPIPPGKVVRHKCDRPVCVNPDHLEIGTQKDNARDMVVRGRLNPLILKNLNHKRAFTDEQANIVRRLASYNLSLNVIAKQFCVDRSTVSLYINNKR